MIPDYNEDTGFLPPGIHEATWQEFVERFGYTEQRRDLLKGFYRAILDLKGCGCKIIYADGGFTTKKLLPPKDIDVCWDINGVDIPKLRALHPVFWDPTPLHVLQKSKYGCEFFAAQGRELRTGKTFLDFFQQYYGTPKGIIKIITDTL